MSDQQNDDNGQCPYCPAEQHLLRIHKQLYGIYSSSQNYYYTKELNEIVEEAVTPANVRFQDLQYYDDYEEFLKRQYQPDEYSTKMYNINQYYYYHRDVPRLYMAEVAKPYARWQDRKKSFLYRRLKRMLHQPESLSESAGYENEQQEGMAPSRVLIDISDYNPFSKKYYLRKKKPPREMLPTETTKNMCEELGVLLKSFGDISRFTVVGEEPEAPELKTPVKASTTRLDEPYKPKDQNTITKFNFKKKKVTIQPMPLTEREGRSTVLSKYSSDGKPSLLTFRRSEQQIVVNHTPADIRRSIPTVSLSSKKESPRTSQPKKHNESLKSMRVRIHKNMPEVGAASHSRLKKVEPLKRKERNDSTREFCDEKMVRPRVESYQSQQIKPVKGKLAISPSLSAALATLQSTQKWTSVRLKPDDEAMNRILRQRFDGK